MNPPALPPPPPIGPRFVAYYRVSTDRQGRSGLGLDAQRDAVARHAAGTIGVVQAAFEEVESGRRSDRPQLALAMAECRLRSCVLLIAKIDRLARDAHFLLGLEKAGVEFIAADMPCANRLTIGVMALVAEEDAAGASQARAIRSAMAATRALEAAPYIVAARQAGATTLSELAVALTARGVRTPHGHEKWMPWQIYERPQDGRGRAVHSSSATSSDLTGRS